MSRFSAPLQRSQAASGLFFGIFEKCVVAERTSDLFGLSQTHFKLRAFHPCSRTWLQAVRLGFRSTRAISCFGSSPSMRARHWTIPSPGLGGPASLGRGLARRSGGPLQGAIPITGRKEPILPNVPGATLPNVQPTRVIIVHPSQAGRE